MNYTKIILIIALSLSFSSIFASPSIGQINDINLKAKIIKTTKKPKFIFTADSKNERKIAYPNKVVYDIMNYIYIGLKTAIGMPLSYEILFDRYLIYRSFYPAGGSGSMENTYLIDLKNPKVWHLSSVEVIGGNSAEYKVSPNKKHMIFYDANFENPFVFLELNNKNSPYVSKIFNANEFEKILKKKLKNKFELQIVEVKLKNSTFEIISNLYFSNIKETQYEKYKLIFDLKTKKLVSFSPILEKELNWEKLHTNKDVFQYEKETILTTEGKFAQISFYKDLTDLHKRTYFLQILRMSDYKILYERSVTKAFNNDSGSIDDKVFYSRWLNNTTSILNAYEENEATYLINIEDSGNKLNVIKNDNLALFLNNTLSKDSKFIIENINKNPDNKEDGVIIEILSIKDNKSIFSCELFKSEFTYNLFKWVTNDKVVFFDKAGKLHLVKVNKNTDLVQDFTIDNLPILSKKEHNNQNILSNMVNSTIAFVADNNLYLLNLDNLELAKITDLNPLEKKEQITTPYITPDGKRVFYMLVSFGYAYDGKLMSVELKK